MLDHPFPRSDASGTNASPRLPTDAAAQAVPAAMTGEGAAASASSGPEVVSNGEIAVSGSVRRAQGGEEEAGGGPALAESAESAPPRDDASAPGSAPEEDASARPAWNAPAAPVAPPAPVETEAAEVAFSLPGGRYNPPITLFLTCATADAEIRYSEDGSEPTPESALYTRGDALFYSQSTVVSARAFAPGMTPGQVATHSYELQAPRWRVVEPEDRADAVPHQRREFVPDYAPGWSLAAASTRGRLHAHRGSWREDAYAHARRGAWVILAVSDGAGSAPLSRVGSQAACDRAVEELRLRLPEHPPAAADAETLKRDSLPALRAQLANAGRAALNGLREAAAIRSEPVEALAATLLVAVLCPWGDGHLAAGLQVGDGQIALLTHGDCGDECRLLGEAEHGAHSSETRFLTTRGVEETMEHRVRFALPGRLAAVALVTDGISDDFFPEDRRLVELFTGESLASMTDGSGAPLRGVLRGAARGADPGRALAEWIEYDRKGSSDDRTLLLLWARE